MAQNRARFEWVELLLIALGLVVSTFALTAHHYRAEMEKTAYFYQGALNEAEALIGRYGPHKYSRNFEEWIIRDFFQDRRNGIFLDVGANHFRDQSNTYYLETALGWSGVAVEALPEFGPDY